jgi:hypothetical protein
MSPHFIGGVKVFVSPLITDRPKFQLSYRMREILSPEYVADFDRWAAEFFGVEHTFYQMPEGIFCSPAGFNFLRKHFRYLEERACPPPTYI